MRLPRVRFTVRRWTVAVIAACFFVMGCIRNEPIAAFDDERLRLLAAGRISLAYLDVPRERRNVEVTPGPATSLVEALRPIRSVRIGQLPPDAVDYGLLIQAGRNPVHFEVHLAADRLVYAEGQFLYEGGNPEAFRRVANAIAKRP